jgi:hypothetical protein
MNKTKTRLIREAERKINKTTEESYALYQALVGPGPAGPYEEENRMRLIAIKKKIEKYTNALEDIKQNC